MLGIFKGIRLMTVRMSYGKYSFAYNELYRKLKSQMHTEQTPFTKCIKNLPQYNVNELLNKDSSCKNYKTNKNISFGSTPFLENFEKLKNESGRQFCYNIFKINLSDWKVLGYKEKKFDTNMKTLYYFINDKFFFGEYVFSDVQGLDVSAIANALLKKYNIENFKSEDRFYISDNSNNEIGFINNGITLTIKYLCRKDSDINTELDFVLNQGKGTSIEESDIFDML